MRLWCRFVSSGNRFKIVRAMLFNIRHSSFLPYYMKVYHRMKAFERMVDTAKDSPNLKERIERATRAAEFAVYHATGYYANHTLEQIFLEAADTIPPVECLPQRGSVLHVMTTAYSSGGHTRVVERWIANSKSQEKHSVVILNQGDVTVPIWLESVVEKRRGKMVLLNEDDVMKRAYALRKIASKYERIILHVHMDDPVALIAFGSKSFSTPIILFNHSDHTFWLGVSIADVVADFRVNSITKERRGVKSSFVLGIPCANDIKTSGVSEKMKVRKELGIKPDDFIVLTIGTPSKYDPIGHYSLCDQFLEIVHSTNDIMCIAIGPDKNSEFWKTSYIKSNGRILPMGIVKDKLLYNKYLQVADLYVGSYPFSGGTTTLDVVQSGLPFLQYIISKQANSIVNIPSINVSPTQNLCYTTRDLVFNVYKYRNKLNLLYNYSKSWMDDYCGMENWKTRLYEMYDSCPKSHTIHPFSIKKGENVIIDDNSCLISFLYEPKSFKIQNKITQRLADVWFKVKGI